MNQKNTIYKLKNNLLRLGLTGLVSFSILSVNLTVHASQYKHVAVPAEDSDKQKLLNPEFKGVFSHSTLLPIYQSQGKHTELKNKQVLEEITKKIYLDGVTNSPILLVGPQTEIWQMKVINPDGLTVYDENDPLHKSLPIESIEIGNQSFKGKKYIMQTPAAGAWQIKISRVEQQLALKTAMLASKKSGLPEAYLMFKGDSNYQLYSHFDNNFTTQNSDLNLTAYMLEAKQAKGNRDLLVKEAALQGGIKKMYATVTTPSNKKYRVALNDQGIKGDKIAGDGLYSAKIPTNEVGNYTSQVQVTGIRPDGIEFSRTATDLYVIAANSFSFKSGKLGASLISTGQNRSKISIPVNKLTDTNTVFMSAEIWGTDDKGQLKSAAWVGGVVDATESKNGTHLALNFDTRWLQRANLNAPYSLRSLRLQDADNNVPLVELDSLPLIADKKISQLKKSLAININDEMLMGIKPLDSKLQMASATSKLLLVHGYCSGQVWNTSNFSNSAEFKDYSQNRSHDQFAQQLISFGSAYSSFGIVAHSQGGAAALHLYSRYWSGLDNATGGRLIQSVGTPYQGTALAGNLALLGQIFGAGCGTNTDLTYNGAANWLATIPSWARNQVDYYTTSFSTRWWAYDYCHIATDLFLSDPDDGTTEKWSGQLSGGVNKGHKTGWCHTNGMRDTAQYKDSSRNSSMSSRAAR